MTTCRPVLQCMEGSLVDGGGRRVELAKIAGKGKYIGLYFSCSWCPPCHQFTPVLAEWYRRLKASERGASLEIVFVSSDYNELDFRDYFVTMPWLALDYSNRGAKELLCQACDVRCIPVFAMVDADSGEILATNGRKRVMQDKKAKCFPWSEDIRTL